MHEHVSVTSFQYFLVDAGDDEVWPGLDQAAEL